LATRSYPTWIFCSDYQGKKYKKFGERVGESPKIEVKQHALRLVSKLSKTPQPGSGTFQYVFEYNLRLEINPASSAPQQLPHGHWRNAM
jgi:hypothetical protein